jgi:2-polyprenyl-6-methoxyphenol hydroxylase-like FAD-dependent oxidoreductase
MSGGVSREVRVMTDVLVVGAGPTGLMLANQLGRRGVRVTIIDRHSGPARESRAMAVHARTLEIYSKLGLSDRALELGAPGYGANMWAGGRLKAHIPFKDMGNDLSPFPYVLMLGQDHNERILGEHLRRWGLSVQWNTELVALEQQADHVKATVKRPDGGTHTITAAYVAGCDGSRSAVRTISGIDFPGAPYEHAFFVADTEATGPMVPHELNVFLWRSGFHLYFPMKGKNGWRVIGILPDELFGRDNVTFEDVIPALLQVGAPGLSFTACHWFSTYRIQHRCVERFRDRRCFLVGDAAHIHSPMGGQGMNTGLQDAYNLAWKLALVLSNRAGEELLDTYEAERRPFAQQLLATTDRAFRVVVSENRLSGLLRTHVIPRVAAIVMSRKSVQRAAFKTISQIGIRYRESALSKDLGSPAENAPHAGDRFPWLHLRFQPQGPREDLFQRLDDTRFNLLVIGQPAPSLEGLGLGDMLQVHAVPSDPENNAALAAVSIAGPSYYLLRPDGHVGLSGTVLQESDLKRWIAQPHLRLTSTSASHAATVS